MYETKHQDITLDNAAKNRMRMRKQFTPAKPLWSSWDNHGIIRDILENELDLTGVKEKEIAELCNFIAHGCTTAGGADLAHYCHAMSNVGAYEITATRIIRKLIDSVREIWDHEENQQALFPVWFEHRGSRDASFLGITGNIDYVPSNVAATYQIYNLVARKLAENPERWHYLSGSHELPRTVPLNVA